MTGYFLETISNIAYSCETAYAHGLYVCANTVDSIKAERYSRHIYFRKNKYKSNTVTSRSFPAMLEVEI